MNGSENPSLVLSYLANATRQRQGCAFGRTEGDGAPRAGKSIQSPAFAFVLVLDLRAERVGTLSGQRWRATRCDGADSSARGTSDRLLQPQSEKLAPSLAREVCVIAGEGGGWGFPHLLETEK